VKTREPFMGSGQVLTLPPSHANNAIYPLTRMAGWLQAIARVNPLTYEGNALRALTLSGGTSVFTVGWDLAISLIITGLNI
jgi:ABC-2 type transport system permease protein